MRRATITLIAVGLVLAPVVEAEEASLRGSPAAMKQQNTVAQQHGLAFYRTAEDIHRAVATGDLVELAGNESYEVADFVSFPYVRPGLDLFVERLSHQYRDACGEKLVVTSATRPGAGQPANAHALSVHPAGMALDLRVSQSATCRSWLESALLGLERRGLINGIREFRPPHYHVAVFPEPYAAYAAERMAVERAERREALAAALASVGAGPFLQVLPATAEAAVQRETAHSRGILAVLRNTMPIGIVSLTVGIVQRLLAS